MTQGGNWWEICGCFVVSAGHDHGTNLVVFIEHTNQNYTTIHFATQANRAYTLQGTVGTNMLPSTWTNLLGPLPPLPLPSHFEYKDYSVTNTGPNRCRMYRLRVT